MGSTRLGGAVAVAWIVLMTIVAGSLVGGAGPASAASPPALVDAAGIHVVASTWLDDRLVDVTLSTAALAAPVHVRVLVPTGYDAVDARRYPSIYLLHGCAAGRPSNGLEYLEWTVAEQAEAVTASTQAIVVMPEAGGGGFYTNWFNGGLGGPPMWETFHVEQLLPWVDQNFKTIPDRGQRAIAGLSMGGFGSLSYASRHPDLFGAAASFSGAADLTNPAETAEPLSSVVVAACAAADGGGPDSTFGSHVTDELNWRDHDPARNVMNLRDTALYLYTGNGDPGPLDPPGVGTDIIEQLAHQSTIGFHEQLVAAGVPSFFDDYGPGTHRAPYWRRDLEDVLPRFVAGFANPATPARITFQTADTTYERWGWRVELHRTAAELSVLGDAGVEGFTLSGSGSAAVTTPAAYEPGSLQTVAFRFASGTVATSTERAGPDGRLTLAVDLGPPNPYQQYTAAADAAGTNVFTTQVTIAAGAATPTSPSSSPSTTTVGTVVTTARGPSAVPVVVTPAFTG